MKRHLTYANVAATVALFLSLAGGTATAAKLLTGKSVKDGSLTGKDLKNSSVTSTDVRNRSLRAADFARGQVPAGKAGVPGQQGPAGPQGATGPAGASALEPLRSGQTIIGGWRDSGVATGGSDNSGRWVPLGAVTADPITSADAFYDGVGSEPCTGTTAAPTAPPGKLCLYTTSVTNLDTRTLAAVTTTDAARRRGFSLTYSPAAAGDYGDAFVWAYTEP